VPSCKVQAQCFLVIDTMKIFVFLSLLSLVYTAPTPDDEALEVVPYIHQEIEALPYEHDATGDVAEAYVHHEIEALPYVHQETPEEEAADQPEAAALPVVSYSYAPLAPVAVTKYTSVPQVAPGAAGVKLALISPFHLVAGYKTGCVNSVGSVVPCHL